MPFRRNLAYGAAAVAVASVLLFSCVSAAPASTAVEPPLVVQAVLDQAANAKVVADDAAIRARIQDAIDSAERSRIEADAKKTADAKARLKNMVASSVMISDKEGHGSGVAIGANLVLTAAHVVAESKDFKVKTSAGETYAARVLWASPDRDVALMLVDTTGKADLTPSGLACRPTELNEPVILVGNALQARWRVANGTVSSSHAPDFPEEAGEVGLTNVLVNLAINSGDSGGPVYDANGDILGLADAVMVQSVKIVTEQGVADGVEGRTAANIGMIVPSSRICPLLGRAS